MRLLIALLVPAFTFAQQQTAQPQVPQTQVSQQQNLSPAVLESEPSDPTADQDLQYVCPMDHDVRSDKPGKCPRCGMTLVRGIPVESEYPVVLSTTPAALKPGEDIKLHFKIKDPVRDTAITKFGIVHEKLYHLFVISQDMTYFAHVHPQIQPDGSFVLDQTFPKPGLYRMLSDFYPDQGTPQLIATTLMVPGAGAKLQQAKLMPDTQPQQDPHGNLRAALTMDPPQPLAGFKTILFVRLTPNDGIEPYLGVYAHVLAASSDLIDMIHTHPEYVTEPEDHSYKQLQFNIIFPRPGIYRVWMNFQRKGVVNTVAFNIPVKELD